MDLVNQQLSSHHWRNAAIAAVAVGAIFVGLALAVGLDPPDTDIKYDWLSARGGLRSDAYADVRDLAAEAGYPIVVNAPTGRPISHPRTPGAILLAVPLLLFDFDFLYSVATFITIVSVVAILWPVLATTDRINRMLLAVMAAICAPTFVTLRFSSQAALVAALTLFAWPLMNKGKGLVGGGVLALAGTLKIFPLILVVPLLLRRRYWAVGATVMAVFILNLAGLALPGVSLSGAIEALTQASVTWVDLPTNGSLVTVVMGLGMSPGTAQAFVGVVLILFLALAVKLRKEQALADPLPWVTAALLLIPLSWASYDLVIMPAAAALLLARAVRPRLTGMTVWAFWIVPAFLLSSVYLQLGAFSAAGRLVILGVWWVGWLTWVDRGFNSIWDIPSSVGQERS